MTLSNLEVIAVSKHVLYSNRVVACKFLEIISVDCHDEERAWKEIVEDYKLKWTQVRDTKENSLAEKYGVSVFPTKFLIDPDGKIRFRLNGENKQFFKMKWKKDVK